MSGSAVTISHATDITALPPAELRSALVRFDAIANLIWHKPPDIFQRLEAWLSSRETGLLLAWHETELVGFSLYRRLGLGEDLVLYRETTNVMPGAQGRGVWTSFTRRLLSDVSRAAPRRAVHLAFRTRNPVIYTANYRYCEAIVPDVFRGSPAASLLDLAARTAERLYPHLPLDRSAMVMPGAYAGCAYREEPRHRDPRVTARFRGIPGLAPPDAALFVLGRVRA